MIKQLLISLLRWLTRTHPYWIVKSGNGHVIAAIPCGKNPKVTTSRQLEVLGRVLPTMKFHVSMEAIPPDEVFQSNVSCYVSYDRRGRSQESPAFKWIACSKEGSDKPPSFSFQTEN